MKDKIIFAILGYGTIGKRYAEIIREMPDVSLGALVDTAAMQTSAEMGCTVYNSLEDFLLHDTSCNVVIVATPNGLHAQHAAKCLEAGKHVLVEKPVAFTAKEAEHLVSLARSNNRMLFPVWQIRYSPLVDALISLSDTGSLGKPIRVEADCLWNRRKEYYNNHPWHGRLDLDGGPLYTQFSHVIDIYCRLFKHIEIINSSFNKKRSDVQTEFEDGGLVRFKLVHEGVGVLRYMIDAPAGTCTNDLVVLTDTAKIKLAGKYFEVLIELTTKDPLIRRVLNEARLSVKEDVGTYCMKKLIENFISRINSWDIATDFTDVRAAAIIEDAYDSRSLSH